MDSWRAVLSAEISDLSLTVHVLALKFMDSVLKSHWYAFTEDVEHDGLSLLVPGVARGLGTGGLLVSKLNCPPKQLTCFSATFLLIHSAAISGILVLSRSLNIFSLSSNLKSSRTNILVVQSRRDSVSLIHEARSLFPKTAHHFAVEIIFQLQDLIENFLLSLTENIHTTWNERRATLPFPDKLVLDKVQLVNLCLTDPREIVP